MRTNASKERIINEDTNKHMHLYQINPTTQKRILSPSKPKTTLVI